MNDNDDVLFAQMMLLQIGLQADQNGRIFDPETASAISFKGKELVAPGMENAGRDAIPFDPYNNPRMMTKLFGYYLERVTEGDDSSSIFYGVDDGHGKGHIELRDGEEILKSGSYQREALRYGDLLLQLNGATTTDLSNMDSPIIRNTINDRDRRSKK